MISVKKLISIVCITFGFLLYASGAEATTTLLHEFAGQPSDGDSALNNKLALVLANSRLYGTTRLGGTNNVGVIFAVDTDGTDYEILHNFSTSGGQGYQPFHGLVLYNSKLYGTTYYGGSNLGGVIYSIDPDGSNYTEIYEFTSATEGKSLKEIVIEDGVIYGIAGSGGSSNAGTVFSINTDGTNFTVLKTLTGGVSDSKFPEGIMKSGTTLYVTTSKGGDDDLGTVFSIGTDGSNYTILHEFAGGASDGSTPRAGVVKIGSTLYGTATLGGDANRGVLFSVGTDGSNYTILREFTNSTSDGGYPYATLVEIGNSILLGHDIGGGANGYGAIFTIETDGSNFTIHHSFAGGASDGQSPYGSFISSGSDLNFYGTTSIGGDSNKGTVYSIELDLGSATFTFSDVTATPTDTGATITWTTSQNTSSQIEYGPTTSYGSISTETDTDTRVTSHSQTLTGLTACTTYHYRVKGSDSLFRSTTGSDNTFTTTGCATSTSTASPSTVENTDTPQIVKTSEGSNEGGSYRAVLGTSTQKISSIPTINMQHNTIPFAANVLANEVSNTSLQSPLDTTNTRKPLPDESPLLIPGGIQLSEIQQIWLVTEKGAADKDRAVIIPELQSQPSVISLPYSPESLIARGVSDFSRLRIAHSVDGSTWTVMDSSVIDYVGQSVAAVGRVGGYYMIVQATAAPLPLNTQSIQEDTTTIEEPPASPEDQTITPSATLSPTLTPTTNALEESGTSTTPNENESFLERISSFFNRLIQ